MAHLYQLDKIHQNNVGKTQNRKVTIRQRKFLEAYLNPDSPAFDCVAKAGRMAGFGPMYSKNLSASKPRWMTEHTKADVGKIKQAEKNIDTLLLSENEKVKMEMSKFVVERLNKNKWSPHRETHHSGGVGIIEIEAQLRDLINNEDDDDQNRIEDTEGGETIQLGEIVVQEREGRPDGVEALAD